MRILITAMATLFLPVLAHADSLSLEWAGQLNSSSGVASPANALGAPDGALASFPFTATAEYSGFGDGAVTNTDSSSLSALLGVTEVALADGDFIAFEYNGSTGFNFETATWTFSDGNTSLVAMALT